MRTDNFQFYPTPASLSQRAWAKFKNRDFAQVLEPSAGDGALAREFPNQSRYGYGRALPIHCIEVDVTHHDALRGAGFTVVGLDFLQFEGGAMYSHVIMNPPFAEGARHVLKAWDLLWDGEIVAIINAETLRNPCNRERRELARLIEEHGEVEYIAGAFAGDDARRSTDVDCALVYLRKTADVQSDIVGDLIESLKGDKAREETPDEFSRRQEVALPANEISNLVRTFAAASRTLRDSIFAQARQHYYSSLLGKTLAARRGDMGCANDESGPDWVRGEWNKQYGELKDRAWAAVLHSSAVLNRLSSEGQRLVESQFESIKKLEFSESNIYGFLVGLCENQGQIQMEMCCAVFDKIGRYHTDNLAYYKGWKSNDKHRTCGMRLKSSRFVLPGHRTESHSSSLPWESQRMLADFDKVFAMLDGRAEPEVSLVQLTAREFRELRAGVRISSSYFDVRYYPGAGTLHFFPRSKALMDRLNRLVGQQRQWLPPEGEKVAEAFWLQYEAAEKLDRELRDEIQRSHASRGRYWDQPYRRLNSTDESAGAARELTAALDAVQERSGIRWGDAIEHDQGEDAQLLLCAA